MDGESRVSVALILITIIMRLNMNNVDSGTLQGPGWIMPTTSSQGIVLTIDLDPGTYSFYLMDDYGDG